MSDVSGHWRTNPATGEQIWVAPHHRQIRPGSGPDPGSEADLRALAEVGDPAEFDFYDLDEPEPDIPEAGPGPDPRVYSPPVWAGDIKHPVREVSPVMVLAITTGRMLRNAWRNVWMGPNWPDHYPPDQPVVAATPGPRYGPVEDDWSHPDNDDLVGWEPVGVTPEQARDLADTGIGPEEVGEWFSDGFTIKDLLGPYRDIDLDGAGIARALADRTGAPVTRITPLVTSGYTDDEIVEMLAAHERAVGRLDDERAGASDPGRVDEPGERLNE